jgi:Helix-turn-helix domain
MARDGDELLTEAELADELKVSRRTLQRWRRDQYGPRWTRVGKAPRYRWADVRAWLEAQAGGPDKP